MVKAGPIDERTSAPCAKDVARAVLGCSFKAAWRPVVPAAPGATPETAEPPTKALPDTELAATSVAGLASVVRRMGGPTMAPHAPRDRHKNIGPAIAPLL